jgi:hypothetical protein
VGVCLWVCVCGCACMRAVLGVRMSVCRGVPVLKEHGGGLWGGWVQGVCVCVCVCLCVCMCMRMCVCVVYVRV